MVSIVKRRAVGENFTRLSLQVLNIKSLHFGLEVGQEVHVYVTDIEHLMLAQHSFVPTPARYGLVLYDGPGVVTVSDQSLEVHEEVSQRLLELFWPCVGGSDDVVTSCRDLIPGEALVIANIARDLGCLDLLEGHDAGVGLQEAKGVVCGCAGYPAGVSDAFGGKVPQFDVLHRLDFVYGVSCRRSWNHVRYGHIGVKIGDDPLPLRWQLQRFGLR